MARLMPIIYRYLHTRTRNTQIRNNKKSETEGILESITEIDELDRNHDFKTIGNNKSRGGSRVRQIVSDIANTTRVIVA